MNPFTSSPLLFTPLNTCRSCLLRLSLNSRRQFHKSPYSSAGRPSRKEAELPSRPARTRFAPSPTGTLHLGSLRTALYNYLIAKRTGGQFLLRIEDTDQNRTIPGAQEQICEELRWAGLQWDEGPEVGGPYGPYIQSERKELYKEHANLLLNGGQAYRCFCLPRDMDTVLPHEKHDPPDPCRQLSPSESEARAADGEEHCVRLKALDYRHTQVLDLTYGSLGTFRPGLSQNPDRAGPVLLKRDMMPTYHLASVVDDHAMNITHVIRGAEWLDSTSLHFSLYKTFGWEPPTFAHVPLLTAPDGAKFSKRSANNLLSAYRDKVGALPEALNNFVALLGWNPGGKSDVMRMDDMVQKFRPNFTKGNAVVTMDKWDFLQSQHTMRRVQNGGQPFDELVVNYSNAVARRLEECKQTGGPAGESAIMDYPGGKSLAQYVASILRIYTKGGISVAETFVREASYFFFEPIQSGADIPHSEGAHPGSPLYKHLHHLLEASEGIPEDAWTKDAIKPLVDATVESYAEKNHVKAIFWGALRAALTFGKHGPGVVDTMVVLGKERTVMRLERYLGLKKSAKGEETNEEGERSGEEGEQSDRGRSHGARGRVVRSMHSTHTPGTARVRIRHAWKNILNSERAEPAADQENPPLTRKRGAAKQSPFVHGVPWRRSRMPVRRVKISAQKEDVPLPEHEVRVRKHEVTVRKKMQYVPFRKVAMLLRKKEQNVPLRRVAIPLRTWYKSSGLGPSDVVRKFPAATNPRSRPVAPHVAKSTKHAKSRPVPVAPHVAQSAKHAKSRANQAKARANQANSKVVRDLPAHPLLRGPRFVRITPKPRVVYGTRLQRSTDPPPFSSSSSFSTLSGPRQWDSWRAQPTSVEESLERLRREMTGEPEQENLSKAGKRKAQSVSIKEGAERLRSDIRGESEQKSSRNASKGRARSVSIEGDLERLRMEMRGKSEPKDLSNTSKRRAQPIPIEEDLERLRSEMRGKSEQKSLRNASKGRAQSISVEGDLERLRSEMRGKSEQKDLSNASKWRAQLISMEEELERLRSEMRGESEQKILNTASKGHGNSQESSDIVVENDKQMLKPKGHELEQSALMSDIGLLLSKIQDEIIKSGSLKDLKMRRAAASDAPRRLLAIPTDKLAFKSRLRKLLLLRKVMDLALTDEDVRHFFSAMPEEQMAASRGWVRYILNNMQEKAPPLVHYEVEAKTDRGDVSLLTIETVRQRYPLIRPWSSESTVRLVGSGKTERRVRGMARRFQQGWLKRDRKESRMKFSKLRFKKKRKLRVRYHVRFVRKPFTSVQTLMALQEEMKKGEEMKMKKEAEMKEEQKPAVRSWVDTCKSFVHLQ